MRYSWPAITPKIPWISKRCTKPQNNQYVLLQVPGFQRPSPSLSSLIKRIIFSPYFAVLTSVILSVTLLLLFVLHTLWLLSPQRQIYIEMWRLSCADIPWQAYPEMSGQALFASEDWYLAPDDTRLKSGQPKMGHFQVCSQAYKSSRNLGILFNNHRRYCQRHGIEYTLYTGGKHGVWRKIEAITDRLAIELDKPPAERTDWLFYSDADTLIHNPLVPLDMFLPNHQTPYLLMFRDSNLMNAGTFFIRVDHRSFEFFKEVLAYPTRPVQKTLNFKEQTAMLYVSEERNMEPNGELVYMPNFFNNYRAEFNYYDTTPIFQYHFPSERYKERYLIPLLRNVSDGGDVPRLSNRELEKGKAMLQSRLKNFWTKYEHDRKTVRHSEG